jgi:hypothetical protein
VKLFPETVMSVPTDPDLGLKSEIDGGGCVAGVITVTSVAVSLDVFCSPPPEIVAVLVTEAGAVAATLTVNVIGG